MSDIDDDDDAWLSEAENDASASPPPRPERAARPPAPAAGSDEEEATLEFESEIEFMERHLVFMYRRDVGSDQTLYWCPRWHEHPEAYSRITALWRAWEHLRLDAGTGMSTWWIEHADRQMSVLFSSKGPFAKCSIENGHHLLEPLPVDPVADTQLHRLIADTDSGEDTAA